MLKRSLILLTVVLVAPLRAGTAQTDDPLGIPPVTLPPALDRVLRDYERAWDGDNSKAIAALFAEDGFVLPNGAPPVRGREAIAKFYKDSGGSLFLRALAFATEGNVGYIIGAYRDEQFEPDDGKFTLTLRKGADGRWMIMSDMDNSNRRR